MTDPNELNAVYEEASGLCIPVFANWDEQRRLLPYPAEGQRIRIRKWGITFSRVEGRWVSE